MMVLKSCSLSLCRQIPIQCGRSWRAPSGVGTTLVRAREAPLASVSRTLVMCTDSKLQICWSLIFQSLLKGCSEHWWFWNVQHPSLLLAKARGPPPLPMKNSFPCIVVGSSIAPPVQAQRTRAPLTSHAGDLGQAWELVKNSWLCRQMEAIPCRPQH